MAALALLRLIGLITNPVFRQCISTSLIAPGEARPAWRLVLGAPALGVWSSG
ncbi:hypothetical protein [Streptomyces sp. NPDC008001]|uniref:hypothetical protein n=1 Tax=Streptomyces sp. NPDC008001 TaxID=3364804 RepID=UPI0036E5F4D2